MGNTIKSAGSHGAQGNEDRPQLSFHDVLLPPLNHLLLPCHLLYSRVRPIGLYPSAPLALPVFVSSLLFSLSVSDLDITSNPYHSLIKRTFMPSFSPSATPHRHPRCSLGDVTSRLYLELSPGTLRATSLANVRTSTAERGGEQRYG